MVMTYQTYVPPSSWTDKGMDWENPLPQLDYFMALQSAMIERMSANRSGGFGSAVYFAPGSMIRYSRLRSLQESIRQACRVFIPRFYQRASFYEKNLLLPHDFIEGKLEDQIELLPFFNLPREGCSFESVIPWMKTAKKMLCSFNSLYQDKETLWENETPAPDQNNGSDHYIIYTIENDTSDIMFFDFEPFSANVNYSDSVDSYHLLLPEESREIWIDQRYFSYSGKITVEYLRPVSWFRFP